MTCRSLFFGFVLQSILVLSFCSARASGWMPNGNTIALVPRNQINVVATSDGAGGAIVVWQDSRNSSGVTHSFDIYAQRVDANGNALWTPNGVAVCTLPGGDSKPEIASDGAGGAIIVWIRTTGAPGLYWDIQAQRIDGSGNAVWPANGLVLGTTNGFQAGPDVMSDGAGGGIFAWYGNADIFAQRIDAAGTPLWGPGGASVCVKSGGQYEPTITTDGAGGAIIAWTDTLTASGYDIYARRVTSSGTLLWSSSGNPICTAPGYQVDQTIVDDGLGGAVIAWRDIRDLPIARTYVQRVNGSGMVQWAVNGIPLSMSPEQQGSAAMLRSGSSIILVSGRGDDLYGQRLDLDGTKMWGDNGIVVRSGPGDALGARVVTDGQNGCFVTWSDSRVPEFDVYAQRIDENGLPRWMANGVPVCTAAWYQHPGGLVADGVGGAIVTWSDDRNGVDPDAYAQHLGPYGPTLTDIGRSPSGRVLNVMTRPNPFGDNAVVELELASSSDVSLEVFDVRGRLVRHDVLRSRPAGWNRFDFSSRDQGGRALPSGVYFLRATAGGSVATEKLVITR